MACGNGCGDVNGLGSNGRSTIESYYDLQQICPKSPLDLIAKATLGSTVGSLVNSTVFNAETWTEINGVVYVDAKPVVSALGTDNLQKVADAAQWNFTHLTWNSDSAVPIPLRRTMFLRAGTEWSNRLSFTFPSTITEMQLSFLNNAATRGDKQGTIPVIDFSGSWSGSGVTLDVVLLQSGCVRMGMWLKNGTTYYMFDMEWNIVP